MISLQPQTNFTIVRQLPDPADSTSYYIQAVVRNSVDDTILKTINLTDKGSRRFKGVYQLPADVSGMGSYIDITTTVYTDSGYTAKSTTYSEELEQYLIWDRVSKLGGGGSGGADIDYKRIAKMLEDMKKAFPKIPPADYGPILSSLKEIKDSISSIEMPEAEKIEYAPVLQAIKSTEAVLLKAIDEKEVTEVPEVNMSPVLEAIDLKQQDMSGIENKLDVIIAHAEKNIENKNAVAELRKVSELLKPIIENTKMDDIEEDKKEVKTDPLQDIVRKL